VSRDLGMKAFARGRCSPSSQLRDTAVAVWSEVRVDADKKEGGKYEILTQIPRVTGGRRGDQDIAERRMHGHRYPCFVRPELCIVCGVV
jgi:hypothetical protein